MNSAISPDQVKCIVQPGDGSYYVEIGYTDQDGVAHQELCDSSACRVKLVTPDEPFSAQSDYDRPISRVEGGRRRANYAEPPGNSVPVQKYWVWEDNYPTMYQIIAGGEIRRGSPNGGLMVTIEGINFGSVLSSFGEEDRDENSAIEIFFLRDDNDEYPRVPCYQIAHYHNPTQLFCVIRNSFPEFYRNYYVRVYINGHQANHHCGCRGCKGHCRIYADHYRNAYVKELITGNMIAPSKPHWTEWYSYPSEMDEEDGQTKHQFREVYVTKSSFNNSHICTAPIAMEARWKLTGAPADVDVFENFTNEYAICNTSQGN